jgi:hypothetical protein
MQNGLAIFDVTLPTARRAMWTLTDALYVTNALGCSFSEDNGVRRGDCHITVQLQSDLPGTPRERVAVGPHEMMFLLL